MRCVALLLALAACGAAPEVATTEQAFTSLCYKAGGDSAAHYPWEASYPLGTQHVLCNHQINDFAQSSWAPQLSQCVNLPGSYQVDVWIGSDDPNDYGWCSRVTLSGYTHYNQPYEPIMELGWLSNSTDAHNRRHVIGLALGRGVVAQAATAATTPNNLGCVWPWTGNCVSATHAPDSSQQSYWLDVGPWQAASIDFYRPPNW